MTGDQSWTAREKRLGTSFPGRPVDQVSEVRRKKNIRQIFCLWGCSFFPFFFVFVFGMLGVEYCAKSKYCETVPGIGESLRCFILHFMVALFFILISCLWVSFIIQGTNANCVI